ncbi:uncharacterized protein [Amphiura filiformis]|uniref:uncharacterized protein isoform X2 n=1 Tax=Amphiura filiformis TaxID=82378 RepID=UPI003B2274D6
MADEEVASSSEKTWEKGPPSTKEDEAAVEATQVCSSEDDAIEGDKPDSSIELKSGVIPVYDNVSTTEAKSSPSRTCYNANNDDDFEEKINTPAGSPIGSPPNGVKRDDLDDSGVSQEELSQAHDSIMQDNMQDIEDRKLHSPELGSDISQDSYIELGSPAAFVRMSPIEKSVEATVSETERNGNLAGLVRLGSSSRESLSGSCDSNANIKSVERTGMKRTLSDTQCIAPDILVQNQESNAAHCSPNRTENGDINNELMTPENQLLFRHRLRSESEPESQFARVERRRKNSRSNPTISLSVQSVNDAMSPQASPSHSPVVTPKMPQRPKSTGTLMMSFIDRKVQEIVDTERSYVTDLGNITQHYQEEMDQCKEELEFSEDDFNILFGNLQDVHRFNKELLEELEKCNNDAVEIAECFLEKERDFSVYTDYCTNYPKAVQVLTECIKNAQIAAFFKKCQTSLGHALPLGAYLLKPVQRVLKYHLLFQDMHKHLNVNADGYDVIQDALDAMTYVAHHINEMKRKHEVAVHVQEIQSQMVGLERDLNSCGDLVLEDVFRLQGARAERYLYLFEKVLLIGKKREDGLINVKTHISCSNLMLIDSIHKEPLGFNVIPFDNPAIQYTIMAKSLEQKVQWTHEIKRMMLENYGSNIPANVKELILKSTTPEPSQPPAQEGEEGLSRDKKERRSRRKKRRNSEPMSKVLAVTEPSATMTKLQRGQRQVKGMKRPAILSRRASEFPTSEVLTDDSLDQDEQTRLKQQSMEDLTTKVRRNSSFTAGSSVSSDTRSLDKRSLDGESPKILNRRSLELDGSFCTLSEEDQESANRNIRPRAGSRSAKESNRDSGIGSMTLSEHPEHLKLDLDERGSNDGEIAEGFTEETSESKDVPFTTHRKKNDSFSKFDTEDDDDDEEEDPEKTMRAIESPDELEALEILNEKVDSSIVDKGGTIDIDSLPAWSPMSPNSDEAFKLRYNIKNYKRMSSSSQGSQPEDDDIWVKMPPRTHGTRGRHPQLGGGHRPLSAEVAGHPHFAKLPLARSSSENFKHLDAMNELYLRTLSDPNMLESQIDKDSDSSKDDRSTQLLDSSISTLGASDEFSLSSASSYDQDENLLESVNSAFKRLGEKYALHQSSTTGEEENKTESEILDGKQDVLTRRAKKVNVTDRRTHPTDAGSVRNSHRTKATINVSAKVPECKQDAPLPLPKRTVRKLAREFSRRAKSLERPSTLVKHRSEPAIKRDFLIQEHSETEDTAWMITEPKGELAQKVQSLKKALDESQVKITHKKDESVSDLHKTTPVLHSDSSTSDDDKNRLPAQAEPVGGSRSKNRKTVHDTVKQFESLSPKRSIEGKVITPNSGMTIQQRLRTIQETSDPFRRSKSVDRSHFNTRTSSPSKTGSPLKSLRERKLELEEWALRPVTRSRYKSEGAFLGVACSDAISNDSNSEGKDTEVFSSRSSRTSSLQSSESASPLPNRRGSEISRRWSSQSSSLSEEDAILFKSIKDRYRELEIAVSKPVPRTCKDARAEIKAIETREEKFKDLDNYEVGPSRLQYEQVDVDEERGEEENVLVFEEGKVVLLDATTGETDTDSIQLEQENESVIQQEDESRENAAVASEVTEEKIVTDIQDAAVAAVEAPENSNTLTRSRAEELMRELNMLSMSTTDEEELSTGTLKHSHSKGDSDVIKPSLDVAESSVNDFSDQIGAWGNNTKDIPIEEDPRSTSTQYSLELDFEENSIEQTHMMDHTYQSTSSDDYCVPMRVTSKVDIDRETKSEGGLSPERKPLPLERVLSSDSNIFLDAKSDLGGSEDSSSQSGFVTPVESFSQD